MANCIFCGEKVGIFSKFHEACASNHKAGVDSVRDRVTSAVWTGRPLAELNIELDEISSQYKISPEEIGQIALTVIGDLCREEPLDTTQYNYIYENIFSNVDMAPDHPFYNSYQMIRENVELSYTLWLVMRGMIDAVRNRDRTPCDVVLRPGEIRLAEFGTVLYRRSVMVSSHAGGYNGMSVRVASGLYYRFGGYAGHTISSPELQNVDAGFLILTNMGMYFAGQQTTVFIPYNSILRFKAYPDGLGFFRNMGGGMEEVFTTINAKLSPPSATPETAVTLHVGWFLFNLVTALTTPNR